jgi:hypothetical protein
LRSRKIQPNADLDQSRFHQDATRTDRLLDR